MRNKKGPDHGPDIDLMQAIADGHAAVAGKHFRSGLGVVTVSVIVALFTATSRGVEVGGEVVDADVHVIGGEVCLREEVKVTEEKAVTEADGASTRL